MRELEFELTLLYIGAEFLLQSRKFFYSPMVSQTFLKKKSCLKLKLFYIKNFVKSHVDKNSIVTSKTILHQCVLSSEMKDITKTKQSPANAIILPF